ncbi:hypothetical protein [Polyangium spumosum]|uniref:Uncharacterized protein n=1 Tax=Polyangium spumosum TaxID=889282 RepID=A0A6N7Q6S7_9BACT|nr:hypothetical protein [Polyangium spumosum]MRG98620.1 hypothetical protein [Polyangium spumosum]
MAEALGYPRGYVAAVVEGKMHVTVHFAGQVARTDVNALAGGPAQLGVGEAAAEGAPKEAEAPPKPLTRPTRRDAEGALQAGGLG